MDLKPVIEFDPKASLRFEKPEIVTRCSDCSYYRVTKANITKGDCYANPPVLVMTPQGPGAARATVNGTDAVCRFFKQK